MRIACGFSLVLCLSLPAAGVAWQRDPAGSATASQQVPSAPAPAETAPAEPATSQTEPATSQPPVVGEKPSETGGTKKTDAGAPSGTVNSTRKRRKRTTPAPDGAPRKVVVREGGTSEPAAQIAPDISPAEATRQRQKAEQLLGSTDGQLKQLTGRTLNAQQQESVGQIRNYMQGARSALKEGDVLRAGTLAEKAHLLSDDLLKH
jgi:hypothetical protein